PGFRSGERPCWPFPSDGGRRRVRNPINFARRQGRRLGHALACRRLSPTARRVLAEHLTYLTPERLEELERCARDAPAGDFLEAGVALGGSAVVLASLMGPERRFHGYDVFGQIPKPSEHDPREAHERYAAIEGHRPEGIG